VSRGRGFDIHLKFLYLNLTLLSNPRPLDTLDTLDDTLDNYTKLLAGIPKCGKLNGDIVVGLYRQNMPL